MLHEYLKKCKLIFVQNLRKIWKNIKIKNSLQTLSFKQMKLNSVFVANLFQVLCLYLKEVRQPTLQLTSVQQLSSAVRLETMKTKTRWVNLNINRLFNYSFKPIFYLKKLKLSLYYYYIYLSPYHQFQIQVTFINIQGVPRNMTVGE